MAVAVEHRQRVPEIVFAPGQTFLPLPMAGLDGICRDAVGEPRRCREDPFRRLDGKLRQRMLRQTGGDTASRPSQPGA
jgi:hypothetical protein